MGNINSWIQFILYFGLVLLITKPIGLYLCRVLDAGGKTFLDPVIKPFEKLTYKLCGVDPKREQDWKQYTVSMLVFSAVTMILAYLVFRFQDSMPFQTLLNPQKFAAWTGDLAFMQSASFVANTDWQSYTPEQVCSYFSNMVPIVFHNFCSSAVGIAICAAVVRGFARQTATTLGNFWVDLVRIVAYLLLPVCTIFAVFLISQGVIQNFKPYDTASVLEPYTASVPKMDDKGNPVLDAKGAQVMMDQKVDSQTIPQGPAASQMAIKMFGLNGDSYLNANAAHPFENPTPLSNFIQMLCIFAIPAGMVYYYAKQVNNKAHGWAIWSAMALVAVIGALVLWWAEAAGNPIHHQLGVDPISGNMEGKEVRFGIMNSALFANNTTAAACGAINCQHDSLTPIGGLVTLFNIHLGEIIFGGVGSGLYGMLVFVAVTVFICGLMVGRTPEYLGKKISPYDVKMASFVILILAWDILGFSAWACMSKWGPPDPITHALTDGTNNSGPHGFSEILYAYSSATGNNGSAFAGLSANTPWYNVTVGLALLIGRYCQAIPILALAGSLVRKKIHPPSIGTFPVTGVMFTFLLISVIILVGALNFFPALALGPIVEHFLMHAGKLF
jgi:K+-transporting ATPase ATPase A chain